ncbi:hypothetical protein SteCoe_37635 [Stentor coeruleus]|uniref:Protein kinase domain-containing protein n=1 Tax=Stentor coeruleus TaxID=5963 RepID=A0A1R2AMN2_9CILI|nr:hypothetical protein SteCoe_37635 [Stentor coeruleus]
MNSGWSFCSLNNSSYFLGNVETNLANGLGIYFEEFPIPNFILGLWNAGKLEQCYKVSNENFLAKAYSNQYERMSIIYSNIPFFTSESHYENRSEDDFIQDLLFKHQTYSIGEYTIKEYFIDYWPLLHGILKTMHFLNFFSKNPSSLEFKFGIYNPEEPRLNFCVMTELYAGTLANNLMKAKENFASIVEFVKLVNEMHLRKIAHNDINLQTLVYVEFPNPKICFNDFSKCQTFSSDIRSDDCFRDYYFTIKKDFKAPEVFTGERYNAFASDVYSTGLVILSIIVGKNLGLASHDEIKKVMNFNQDIPQILLKALQVIPKERCNMSVMLNEINIKGRRY